MTTESPLLSKVGQLLQKGIETVAGVGSTILNLLRLLLIVSFCSVGWALATMAGWMRSAATGLIGSASSECREAFLDGYETACSGGETTSSSPTETTSTNGSSTAAEVSYGDEEMTIMVVEKLPKKRLSEEAQDILSEFTPKEAFSLAVILDKLRINGFGEDDWAAQNLEACAKAISELASKCGKQLATIARKHPDYWRSGKAALEPEPSTERPCC